MRDYAVVANIKAEQKGIIDDVFDKGYEQGYHDGKLDGEAEKIEKLEKQFDDEKKAEYKRGYADGKKEVAAELNFEKGYDKGYEDGTKAKDGERGSIYYGGYSDGLKDGYEKGLKHGQELRVKEAECAEACGMKRAWEAARKIYDIQNVAMIKELFGADAYYTIYNFTASEVVEKIEAWEKKQKENEKVDCNNTDCKNCINHNDCDYEDEWKLRRRGIVPAPPKEKQSEKSCKDCKYFYHGYFTIACFDCKDFSLFEHKKEEQTTTLCRKCIHAHNMHDNILTCDAVPCVIEDGHCDKYEEKQETELSEEAVEEFFTEARNCGNQEKTEKK